MIFLHRIKKRFVVRWSYFLKRPQKITKLFFPFKSLSKQNKTWQWRFKAVSRHSFCRTQICQIKQSGEAVVDVERSSAYDYKILKQLLVRNFFCRNFLRRIEPTAIFIRLRNDFAAQRPFSLKFYWHTMHRWLNLPGMLLILPMSDVWTPNDAKTTAAKTTKTDVDVISGDNSKPFFYKLNKLLF